MGGLRLFKLFLYLPKVNIWKRIWEIYWPFFYSVHIVHTGNVFIITRKHFFGISRYKSDPVRDFDNKNPYNFVFMIHLLLSLTRKYFIKILNKCFFITRCIVICSIKSSIVCDLVESDNQSKNEAHSFLSQKRLYLCTCSCDIYSSPWSGIVGENSCVLVYYCLISQLLDCTDTTALNL